MQLPNWMIQLQLDNSAFLRGLAASTQATRDFDQALAMVGTNGMNALMGVYQIGPMFQGAFQKLKGTIQDSIGAFAKYESTLTSVEFLAGNMGTTMDEVNQAVKQLTSDGLMTATGAMEALKASFTLSIPVQNATASIELLKNSLMAAGKDPNLMANVIASIRTMNSQRLDEYGITKNLDQMLKEESKTLQKLLTDKKALATADAQYKILIDSLPESYRKMAANGKDAVGSLKEKMDETTRNTLMLIGVTREAAANYTSFTKFKKDKDLNPKDALQTDIEKDFANRFLTMVQNTKDARKQGGQAFREAFLSDENIAVYAARSEKMAEIFQKSIKRGIIQPGKEQSLTQMGLGGLDEKDDKKRQDNFQQRKRSAAQLLVQAEAFDAMLAKYNEKEQKAGRQVVTIAELRTRSLEEQKKIFTEIGASFDNAFYMIFSGAKTAAAQNLETALGQMRALMSEFMVNLGEVFSKPLKAVIDEYVRPFLTGLSQLDGHTMKNIATVIALGTAFVGLAAAVTSLLVTWRMMAAGFTMINALLDETLAKTAAMTTKIPLVGSVVQGVATVAQRSAQRLAERKLDRNRGEVDAASDRELAGIDADIAQQRNSSQTRHTRETQAVEDAHRQEMSNINPNLNAADRQAAENRANARRTQALQEAEDRRLERESAIDEQRTERRGQAEQRREEARAGVEDMHREKMRSLSGDVRTPEGMMGVIRSVASIGDATKEIGSRLMGADSSNAFRLLRESASDAVAPITIVSQEIRRYVMEAGRAAMVNPLRSLAGGATAGIAKGIGAITFAVGSLGKALISTAKAALSMSIQLLPMILLGEAVRRVTEGMKSALEAHNKLKGTDGKESSELAKLRQTAAGKDTTKDASAVAAAKEQVESYDRMEVALRRLDHAFAIIRGSFASFASALTGSSDGIGRLGTIVVEVSSYIMHGFAKSLEFILRMTAGVIGALKQMWTGLKIAVKPVFDLFAWGAKSTSSWFDAMLKGVSSFTSRWGGFFQPLKDSFNWLLSKIDSFISKSSWLTTLFAAVAPGTYFSAHAVKGFSQGLADFDKNHQENIAKEDRAKAAKKAGEKKVGNTYAGKPTVSKEDGESAKSKKDPYADALALLKLQEQLAILRATSDKDIVNARAHFKEGLAKLVKQFPATDPKKKLEIQKEVEEAANALIAARATSLEHEIQKQEKLNEHLRITQKLMTELTLHSKQYQATLVGDKVGAERAQSTAAISEAQQEVLEKERQLEVARRKVQLAELRVQERGGSVGSNLNALAAAKEELDKVKQEAELAKEKQRETELKERRKQQALQAEEKLSKLKYKQEQMEPEHGVTGSFDRKGLEEFKKASNATMGALNQKFKADPSFGDAQKTLQQFKEYREVLKQVGIEELKTTIRNSQTLQEEVTNLAASHTKATDELKTYEERLKDVNKTEKILADRREELVKQSQNATTSQERQRADKALEENAERLNRAHQASVLLTALVASWKEKGLLALKASLESQQQLNEATASYYELVAQSAEKNLSSQGVSLTTQKEELEALLVVRQKALALADQELKLAELRVKRFGSPEDKKQLEKARSGKTQAETNLLIAGARQEQGGNSPFSSIEQTQKIFQKLKEDAAQLNTLTDGDPRKADLKRQFEELRKEYELWLTKTLEQPISLGVKVIGHWEEFSKQAADAFGNAFKEAFLNNDWTDIGQKVSQRMSQSFKEAVGNSIGSFINQPIENSFKNVTTALQKWGAQFTTSLGEKGPEVAKAFGDVFTAIQGAIAVGALLWATAAGSGGKGEQAIKEGEEIFDQTQEVRGVVVGETNIGIGKLKELFDPVAIAMQAAAQAMVEAANAIRNAQAMGGVALPAVGGTGVGGNSINANNVITVNLNATGVVTVVADIDAMKRQINIAIQNTVESEVKRAIVNQMSR